MDQVSPATVLVVDDNAGNRALAQATLEDEGYRVVLAKSGAEALAVFQDQTFDCILLDIQMPDMDGIEACERLRGLPGGGDVPIVFVTAQRDVDTFDRARLAGGDDFITRPVRPSELVLRVQAATKLRRIAIERNELYDLIRQQRDDLMRLQLQREQLIAFLVHDLKNPVHAIELHAQIISRAKDSTPRSRTAADKIRADSSSLLRMIMNLLDLSKADEGRLVPSKSRVELAPLIAEIVDTMGVRAAASEVALESDLRAEALHGDPELVRRVLENLIDNAIRHAPEGSAVKVAAVRKDGHVELRVADAGPGVPQEQRPRVFERFVQGETTARAGRGLGLAFCKIAVEAHGGAIWIEDAAPGAVFCASFDAV